MATFILADDSKIARKMLRTVLLENGYEVIGEASDGLEAYDLYTKLMPDIIFLDITMPIVNGMEALKRIKSSFPKAKIIMITSIGKDSKRAEAIMSGALDYIVKPFDPEQVIEIVERCIRA